MPSPGNATLLGELQKQRLARQSHVPQMLDEAPITWPESRGVQTLASRRSGQTADGVET